MPESATKKRKLNEDEVDQLQNDYDKLKEELALMKRKYNRNV